MTTILVVGYNAWDTILPVPKLPAPDAKLEVSEIISCGGGPAANAAVAMARLGADVRLVTVLADDPVGHRQRADLLESGVDLRHARTVPGASTPRAVILVDPQDGSRRILWSRGDLPRIAAEDVDRAWLADIDLLFCDSHEPAAALRLAEWAATAGIPAVMDAGTAREGTAALASACSDVVSSDVFATALFGIADPRRALLSLLRGATRRAAMTFGAEGCLGVEDGGIFHVPAFAVQAVDTTGAGDAFHAGYAFALAQGRGFRAALEFGSAVAALKCRDYGGRRALPGRIEVEDLLRDGSRSDRIPE